MVGGEQRKGGKHVGRITAQLPQNPMAAPTPPVDPTPALVVDEAMPDDEDHEGLFEDLDATEADYGSPSPHDTNVMLAAFDDATEVQKG